jgi:glycosyltransferase involved in cell wall biosynthesis
MARIGIISSYPPEKDGIAPAAKYHAEALKNNTDHEPVIISSSENADYQIDRHSFTMWRQVNEAVEEHNIDILHAHHTLTLYKIGGYNLALVRRDTPLVVSFHEPRHQWTNTLNPKFRIAHHVEDLIYRRADHRIVHTQKDKDKFTERYGPENLSSINLGNPVRESKAPEKIEKLLVFGFIHPNKDIKSVIESADHHDKQIIVAGSETQDYGIEEELEKAAENRENVELRLRYIPEEEKEQLFTETDAVIIPYLYGTEEATREASDSGVLREAMSYQKPVITSETSIFKETFKKHKIGEITELEPEKIAEAIHNLENNLEKLNKEVNKFNEENSWSKIIQKYSEIYSNFEEEN